MPTAIVYAPITGVVSQDDISGHIPCHDNGTYSTMKPVDIGPTTTIKTAYMWVNYPTVRSIQVSVDTSNTDTTFNFECCDNLNISDNTIEKNLRRAVKVKLFAFANYCCPIGWVLFGHLENVGFSVLNNPNLTSGYCGQLGKTINYNAGPGSCYQGEHIHMECSSSGVLLLNNGNGADRATTPVYQWDYSLSGCTSC
jgi:hypothetical protein